MKSNCNNNIKHQQLILVQRQQFLQNDQKMGSCFGCQCLICLSNMMFSTNAKYRKEFKNNKNILAKLFNINNSHTSNVSKSNHNNKTDFNASVSRLENELSTLKFHRFVNNDEIGADINTSQDQSKIDENSLTKTTTANVSGSHLTTTNHISLRDHFNLCGGGGNKHKKLTNETNGQASPPQAPKRIKNNKRKLTSLEFIADTTSSSVNHSPSISTNITTVNSTLSLTLNKSSYDSSTSNDSSIVSSTLNNENEDALEDNSGILVMDDYENSWNNDKLIDENFNLNFDINQSPHLYLIGQCSNMSNSLFDDYNMELDEQADGTIDANTSTTAQPGLVSYFLSKLNNYDLDTVYANEANVERIEADKVIANDKKILLNSKYSTNHTSNDDEQCLYYFHQVNQVNVDGFEWDLI